MPFLVLLAELIPLFWLCTDFVPPHSGQGNRSFFVTDFVQHWQHKELQEFPSVTRTTEATKNCLKLPWCEPVCLRTRLRCLIRWPLTLTGSGVFGAATWATSSVGDFWSPSLPTNPPTSQTCFLRLGLLHKIKTFAPRAAIPRKSPLLRGKKPNCYHR